MEGALSITYFILEAPNGIGNELRGFTFTREILCGTPPDRL